MAHGPSRRRTLRFAVAAVATLAAGGAARAAVPLPRPAASPVAAVPLPPERPEDDGPPMPPAGASRVPAPGAAAPAAAIPPLPPGTPPAVPSEPDPGCASLLAGGTVAAAVLPPIAEPGGCGIAAPVRIGAVILRDGHRVPLAPPAVMRCDLAAVFADWLRDDVVPASRGQGDLLEIEDAAAYVCRSRNRLPGERLSEHARGNAIDVLALRFTAGTMSIADGAARPFWAALAPSACRRFATVLGPGSDAYHATDLHLDLEHRRNGAHLCQWHVSRSMERKTEVLARAYRFLSRGGDVEGPFTVIASSHRAHHPKDHVMSYTIGAAAPATGSEPARDLQLRLYREIGISAVAAALRLTTRPDPKPREVPPADGSAKKAAA